MAERVLGAPPSVVWSVVSDPQNFVALDPYHHDYVSTGRGRFSMRHSWFPLLPRLSETFTCTVLAEDAPRRVLFREEDEQKARVHEQEFLIGRSWRGGTRLQIYVRYTPPRWGRTWLSWQVQYALQVKLGAIDRACLSRPAIGAAPRPARA